MSKKGKLFIISAPSGTGKTTVMNQVLAQVPSLVEQVVTCTTRKRREAEIDGKDYHFLSREQFAEREGQGGFLETKVIYKNHYGTPKCEVEKRLNGGKNVLLIIDVKGAKDIIEQKEFSTISIYLAPPSIDELKKRIEKRGSENSQSFEERVKRATEELSYKDKYDYVVTNDDFSRTCEEVQNILEKETQH